MTPSLTLAALLLTASDAAAADGEGAQQRIRHLSAEMACACARLPREQREERAEVCGRERAEASGAVQELARPAKRGQGARVRGVVLDGARQPLPGVEVRAYAQGRSGAYSVVTDAQGRFDFTQLEDLTWCFVPLGPGLPVAALVASPKKSAALVLELEPYGRLSVSLEREGGDAAEGATLEVRGDSGETLTLTTGGGGGASTPLLPFGPYELTGRVGDASAFARVELAGRQEVRLKLQRTFALTGRILSSAGGPLAGARIEAAFGGKIVAGARSDKGGRFVLAHPVGPSTTLTISAPGHVSRQQPQHTATGRANTGDLVLQEDAPLSGTVRGPGAAPLEGARLVAEGPVDALASARTRVEVVSGAQGRFELRGLPEGKHRLLVTSPGFATSEREVSAPEADLQIQLDATAKPRAKAAP